MRRCCREGAFSFPAEYAHHAGRGSVVFSFLFVLALFLLDPAKFFQVFPGSRSDAGIDVGQLFQNATNGLSRDGQALQAKMDEISASGEVDQMELLELQFAMGQYNAKLETISSVTKSIQDMLKSLAQRTG